MHVLLSSSCFVKLDFCHISDLCTDILVLICVSLFCDDILRQLKRKCYCVSCCLGWIIYPTFNPEHLVCMCLLTLQPTHNRMQVPMALSPSVLLLSVFSEESCLTSGCKSTTLWDSCVL